MEEIRYNHLSSWNYIPEPVLVKILKQLNTKEVIACSEVCADWNHVCEDQLLWKHLFARNFSIKDWKKDTEQQFLLRHGATHWKDEYIRLKDNVPSVLIQTLNAHTDEVLHVAFSHDGKEFISCSKDNTIVAWKKNVDGNYMPTETKDMSIYNWTCPAQAQYSPSDTNIMVLGKIDIDGYTDLDLVIFSRNENYKTMCRLKDKNPFHPILQRYQQNIGQPQEPYVHFLSTTISPNGYWFSDNSFLFATEENKGIHALIDMYTSIWVHPIPKINDSASENEFPEFEDPLITFKSNYSEGWASFTVINNILKYKQMSTNIKSKEYELTSCHEKVNDFGRNLFPNSPDHDIAFESKLSNNASVNICPANIDLRRHRELLAITLSLNRVRKPNLRYGVLVHQITFHYIPSIQESKQDYIEKEPFKSLDINGVIIGAALDNKEEFLYLNVRLFNHKDGNDVGRYGQEVQEDIQIRVINLKTLEYEPEGMIGHKGFTKKIFNGIFRLDVETSENFISSGSEDSKGYIWDRYYKCLISTLPHDECVSCVAFDPTNEEICVTASDDYTLKVWCSKRHKRCNV